MIAPKDNYTLIHGTHEYVLYMTKRTLQDVIKLRILRWEIILDYPVPLNIVTSVLIFLFYFYF